MRISSNELIAGYSALKVRDFLRRYRFKNFYVGAAANALALSLNAATTFMDKLEELGFVEGLDKWGGRRVFNFTIKGQALANASAAKPLHRKTAELLLKQFMGRVQRVNSTHKYAYRVEHVVLFGSMLGNVDRLSDVDLAIQLRPKVDETEALRKWQMGRRRAAEAKGRNFRNISEWVAWPTEEIFLQLKARSTGLSLHDFCQLKELPDVRYRVLFGDPQLIAAKIGSGEAV